MRFVVNHIPTQKQFMLNIEEKMNVEEFLNDMISLLRINEKYDHNEAYKLIKKEIIQKL